MAETSIKSFIFQSLAGVLGGVIGTNLKAKIGWRGLFFFSGGINVIRKRHILFPVEMIMSLPLPEMILKCKAWGINRRYIFLIIYMAEIAS